MLEHSLSHLSDPALTRALKECVREERGATNKVLFSGPVDAGVEASLLTEAVEDDGEHPMAPPVQLAPGPVAPTPHPRVMPLSPSR
jgi:hypothetical protein